MPGTKTSVSRNIVEELRYALKERIRRINHQLSSNISRSTIEKLKSELKSAIAEYESACRQAGECDERLLEEARMLHSLLEFFVCLRRLKFDMGARKG